MLSIVATMEGALFDPDTVYTAEDVAARGIANYYSTLAKWRMAPARGPAFIQDLARAVGYRGADLNRWLSEQTVHPTAA